MRSQSNIFEIIHGEIQYVSDLSAIEPVSSSRISSHPSLTIFDFCFLFLKLFIAPLLKAEPVIIEPERVNGFIHDVFHNYREILDIHQKLLSRLAKRQRDQHPTIGSVTDLIYDAMLQWGDAYR